MVRYEAATLILLLGGVTGAMAESLEMPKFSPQDVWTYHEKRQKRDKLVESDVEVSVIRADSEDLLVGVKPVGSTKPPVETMYRPDWAKFRGVNGVETIVNKPLDFPLAPGKTWTMSYTENNPNPAHEKEAVELVYKVVGWEDITTPAGSFKTLRIEGRGSWVADIPARVQSNSVLGNNGGALSAATQRSVQGAQRVTGRLYRDVWYAPEVKCWVKFREESFNSNGVATESNESDLTAFHVAPP